MEDSVEMCRESAAQILAENFTGAVSLHHVIPIVSQRLVDTAEPSEEVRLAFLKLTVAAAAGSDKKEGGGVEGELNSYMEDFREIAVTAVQV